MRGVYFAGLIIAGLLTFIPGRVMYRMFFAEAAGRYSYRNATIGSTLVALRAGM
jgi:hypothetical protein